MRRKKSRPAAKGRRAGQISATNSALESVHTGQQFSFWRGGADSSAPVAAFRFPVPRSPRAGNGSRRKAAARAICGPRHPRGVQPATGSSVRGFAAPQLASRGRLPALSPVPRAPRPNAARPAVRSLRPLRPLRLRGLRAHRFRVWGPGCGACRRGCARTALRSRLCRPHPGSPSIGICALRPWPSGIARPALAPSPAYRGAWRSASVSLFPNAPPRPMGRAESFLRHRNLCK